jgi:hypothetical protein
MILGVERLWRLCGLKTVKRVTLYLLKVFSRVSKSVWAEKQRQKLATFFRWGKFQKVP